MCISTEEYVKYLYLQIRRLEEMARPSKVNQKKQAKNQSRKNEGGKKQKKQQLQKKPQGSN